MSVAQPSTTGSPSPMQDPSDWTVDQVVFALTDKESSLLKSNPTLSLPKANDLARVLRENDVNGLALLNEVKANCLRDELGIKSMSHRASINYWIRHLQGISPRYQQQLSSSMRASSIGVGSGMGTPFLGSPLHHQVRASSTALGAWNSPTLNSGDQSQSLPWNDTLAASGLHPVAVPARDTLAGAVAVPHPELQHSSCFSDSEGLGISKDGVEAEVTEPHELHVHTNCSDLADASMTQEIGSLADLGPELTQQQRPNETTIVDENGKRRRRLVLAQATVTKQPVPVDGGPDPLNFESNSASALQIGDTNVPLVESTPSPIRQILSVEEDGMLLNNFKDEMDNKERAAITDQPPGEASEPGELLIDEKNGRKRMRPILITEPDLDILDVEIARAIVHLPDSGIEHIAPSPGFKQTIYGRKANRSRDQIYLGPEPLPIDEIFYGDVPLEAALDKGREIEHYNDADEFTVAPDVRSSNGVAAYVNARMKYFLRSPSRKLKRGVHECVGIVPYPDRIGRKHYPLSMTVFYPSPNGVSVTRSNRQKWIEHNFTDPTNPNKANSDVFNVADPELARDIDDDPEWKALEKWKYMNGHDDILPVYGESGSEGEYELDTWREMEQERGHLARPVGASKSHKLTAEEVENIIQRAIQQTVEGWGMQRKPKLLRKAWSQWTKSRRYGTAKAQLEKFTHDIQMLDSRISALQKEIAEEEWSTIGQLSKQCKILQPSIFDREDCKWKCENLNSRRMPAKLPPTSTTKNQPETTGRKVAESLIEEKEGEENLETDVEASESSEGSLGDFIVDDEDSNEHQSLNVEEDITLADVEDEVESETLIADQDDLVSLVKKSEQYFKNSNDNTQEPTGPQTSTLDKASIIDLTLDSDPVQMPTPERKSSFVIKTPPLNNSGDESDVFQRSRSKQAVFTMPPTLDSRNVISLESESAESTAPEQPSIVKKELPTLTDVVAIREMDPSILVERQDRKRLLTWIIAHSKASRRQAASDYLTQNSFEESQSETTAALKKIRGYGRRITDMDNKKSDCIMSIASWHVCWTIPVKVDQSGLRISHIETTLADDGFGPFYDFLLECLSHCRIALDTTQQPTPSKKRQRIFVGSDEEPNPSLLRKRKYVVTESQQTLEKRQAAQERLRGDEARRLRELESRRLKMASATKDGSDIIVNPGKREEEEYIYLNPRFGNGADMKEHQKQGLQFMWREVTTDHKDMQGCLLAHNQGLGKTMQVIALLVTLAETARSSNKTVRQQIPRQLHKTQTLILCPPGLVENWWDELLLWPPSPLSSNIKKVRKVNSSMGPSLRLTEIHAWSNEGGVLVLGYDTFKGLVHNKKSRISPEQHHSVLESLLERPNLVVADEAQTFKNRTSDLAKAIHQIKTGSRIALTGTPLANNLEEYFSVIDWMSPNYLGSPAEFRAVYEEPIKDGSWEESTTSQYRESRKRLFALEIELGPKVHRAGVDVLDEQLYGKMEFIIKVPLTKLQEDIYRVYIECIMNITSNDEPRQTTLWSWLHMLQLLCNHPTSYKDKLEELKAQAAGPLPKKKSLSKKKVNKIIGDEGSAGSEEDTAILLEETSGSRFAMSQVIPKSEAVLAAMTEPLDALRLSNKMTVLMKILEFAEAAQDKVLVFSHRLGSLNYVNEQLVKAGKAYARIDGGSVPQKRQTMTKDFNDSKAGVCLISTRAGGTGLNLFGANRVVILDETFNPALERQAIGRAYRIGQTKPVYVYRLTVAGTFEQALQNQALFKEQLATRAVDGKHPNRSASKDASQYLFLPKPSIQESLDPFIGKDPLVLDRLLADQATNQILSIVPTESLHVEDGVELTVDEKKDAALTQKARKDQLLHRRDLGAHDALLQKRIHAVQEYTKTPPSTYAPPGTPPIPWNHHSIAGKMMTCPPSTAPSFMGGLPYPDSRTSGVFTYHSYGRPSFVPGPSWSVSDVSASEIARYERQSRPSLGKSNPLHENLPIASSSNTEDLNSSRAIERQLGVDRSNIDPSNTAPSIDLPVTPEIISLRSSTPSSTFEKDNDEVGKTQAVGHEIKSIEPELDRRNASQNGMDEHSQAESVGSRRSAARKETSRGGMLSKLPEPAIASAPPNQVRDKSESNAVPSSKKAQSNRVEEADSGPRAALEKERRKHSLSKQSVRKVSKRKPGSLLVTPNFASSGPTEDQFTTFLNREASRSSK